MTISSEDYRERAVNLQRPAYRTEDSDAELRALVEPLQEIALEIRQLATARHLGLAGSGFALDEFGGRINVRRASREDPEYLRAIQAELARINSDGLPEDLIAILRLLLGRPLGSLIRQERDRGVHTFLLENFVIATQAELDALGVVVDRAASAGKRIILRAGADPLLQSFRFGWFVHASAPALLGATTITIYPNEQTPLAGHVHPAGSAVIAYTRSGATITLASPLGAAVTSSQQIPLVDAAGAPIGGTGGEFDVGTWWSSAG